MTPELARKFRRRSRKYMLAYDELSRRTTKEDEMTTPSSSHQEIEELVKNTYVSEEKLANQQDQRRKRKRKQQPTLSNKQRSTKETLELRHQKCLKIGKNESEQRLQNEKQNSLLEDTIDVWQMQQIQEKHRGSHQDVSFLNSTIKLFLDDEEEEWWLKK